MDKFHIVIAGHIDHGKSTLIGRLLHDTHSLPEGRLEEIRASCAGLDREFEFAYITDALLEERQDRMTIDTTQVVFKTGKREYIIIDTPGHKELLRNMVTGVSYAEGAILIVSASEGIQEQTRRHAHILGLFGIKDIIVVINKMDEVSYSQEVFISLKGKLEELFAQFGIRAAYIIPISAKSGDNVVSLSQNTPWYQDKTVLGALDSLQITDLAHDFRMAVQDIYPLNGEDIIVGRICSGKIKRGDKVVILPARKESSVSSVRVFEREKEEARAGESVGLVLEASPAPKRGDILSAGSLPSSGIEFKALVLCLKDKLLMRTPYLLQCATKQVSCKITEIGDHMDIDTLQDLRGDFLNKSEISRIALVTDTPLVYEEFNKLHELGRFVLRKGSDIVGAGVIL